MPQIHHSPSTFLLLVSFPGPLTYLEEPSRPWIADLAFSKLQGLHPQDGGKPSIMNGSVMVVLESNGFCGPGSPTYPTVALLASFCPSQHILATHLQNPTTPHLHRLPSPSLLLLDELHSALGLFISQIYTEIVAKVNI